MPSTIPLVLFCSVVEDVEPGYAQRIIDLCTMVQNIFESLMQIVTGELKLCHTSILEDKRITYLNMT